MTKIEELEQKLNEWFKTVSKEEMIKILEEEGFEVIDKESKKEGKWQPKDREEYWFMDTDGNLMFSEFDSENRSDRWRVDNLPIFRTHGEAYRYWHFMDTVKEKSYEFSKEEWDDESLYKYHIRYQYYNKKIEIDSYTRTKIVGTIYFKTEEDCQYIIDNFQDELMEWFL